MYIVYFFQPSRLCFNKKKNNKKVVRKKESNVVLYIGILYSFIDIKMGMKDESH